MKQSELLETQTNQTTQQENTSIWYREQIPKTPFWIVGNNEKGYFITFGKYQISEPLDLKDIGEDWTILKEAKMYLTTNHWDITTKIILIILQDNQLIK